LVSLRTRSRGRRGRSDGLRTWAGRHAPTRHVLGRALRFSPAPRARGEGQVGRGAERPPKRGGVRGLRPKDWGWGLKGKSDRLERSLKGGLEGKRIALGDLQAPALLLPWDGSVSLWTRSRGLRGYSDGHADLGRAYHAHAACPGAVRVR